MRKQTIQKHQQGDSRVIGRKGWALSLVRGGGGEAGQVQAAGWLAHRSLEVTSQRVFCGWALVFSSLPNLFSTTSNAPVTGHFISLWSFPSSQFQHPWLHPHEFQAHKLKPLSLFSLVASCQEFSFPPYLLCPWTSSGPFLLEVAFMMELTRTQAHPTSIF